MGESAAPGAAATRGDNFRDNVEQVVIASPAAGDYTVSISHKSTLAGGPQDVEQGSLRAEGLGPERLEDRLVAGGRFADASGGGARFHLAGRIEINEWGGKKRVQLRLEDAAPVTAKE